MTGEGKSTNLTARTDAEKSPSLGTNTANNKDNNNARNNKNTENTGNKNKIKNENTNTESDSNATVSTQEEDEGLKWSNKLIGNLVLKKLKRFLKIFQPHNPSYFHLSHFLSHLHHPCPPRSSPRHTNHTDPLSDTKSRSCA